MLSFILHNVTWRQHSIAATEQHGNAGKKQWVGMCFLLVGRLLSFKMQLHHCHYQSAFRHIPRILLQPALCTIVTYSFFFLRVLFCQVELKVCHWLESQQQCTHTFLILTSLLCAEVKVQLFFFFLWRAVSVALKRKPLISMVVKRQWPKFPLWLKCHLMTVYQQLTADAWWLVSRLNWAWRAQWLIGLSSLICTLLFIHNHILNVAFPILTF